MLVLYKFCNTNLRIYHGNFHILFILFFITLLKKYSHLMQVQLRPHNEVGNYVLIHNYIVYNYLHSNPLWFLNERSVNI